MRESTAAMARLTYEVATVLTVVLLVLYTTKRNANIPLTYLTPFSDWSAVKNVFQSRLSYAISNGTYQVSSPSWALLAGAAWCGQPTDSPQCACLLNYYRTGYLGVVAGYDVGNLTLDQYRDASYTGAVTACLRERPTWRKDTCNTVCSVHLATPVLLCCLLASLFLSRVSEYRSHTLNLLAHYVPLFLAGLTFVFLLVMDGTAGILACLTILGALLESSYVRHYSDSTAVYYSYQRYLLGTLGSWAAVTHQARDLYLAPAYGALGFFVGTFAYYSHLVAPFRSRITRTLSICLWVGSGAVLGCLVLLVQQNWLRSSPVASSAVSVAALFLVLAPCVFECPDRVRVGVGLGAVCACFLAVAVDLAGQ